MKRICSLFFVLALLPAVATAQEAPSITLSNPNSFKHRSLWTNVDTWRHSIIVNRTRDHRIVGMIGTTAITHPDGSVTVPGAKKAGVIDRARNMSASLWGVIPSGTQNPPTTQFKGTSHNNGGYWVAVKLEKWVDENDDGEKQESEWSKVAESAWKRVNHN